MTGQGKSAIDTLLAESFKELALKQPIEKITIKEITDKAGVIRPTFYNHFQDKYELLEWIIDTQLIAPAEPFYSSLVHVVTSIKNKKLKSCSGEKNHQILQTISCKYIISKN